MAQATRKRPAAAAPSGKGARSKATTKKKSGARKGASRITSKKASASRRGASASSASATRAASNRTLATATLANTLAIGQMARLLREVGAIACGFAALLTFLALAGFHIDDPGWSDTGAGDAVRNSVGRAGAWFADVALYLFGFMAYLIPMILGISAWLLLRDRRRTPNVYRPFVFIRIIGVMLMLAAASGLADLHFSVPDGSLPRGTFGGGILGTAVAWRLVAYLHHLGTTLLLLALFFSSMTLAFGTSWLQLVESIGAAMMRGIDRLTGLVDGRTAQRDERARQRQADEARRARYADAVPGATEALAGLSPSLSIDADRPQARRGLFASLFEGAGSAGGTLRRLAEGSDGDELAARTGSDAARRDARAESLAASFQAADPLMRPAPSIEADAADEAPVKPKRRKAASGKKEPRAAVEPGGAPGVTPGIAPEAAAHASTDHSTDEALGEAVAARLAMAQEAEALDIELGEAAPTPSPVAARTAPAPDSEEMRKKRIAIRERAHNEERQAKLYLDVPDTDLPPMALLDAPAPVTKGFSEEELRALSLLLEEKLAEFKIEVQVVAVQPGPVITRFEMQLAPGIKASRVTGLSQDIARSLSLTSVRVVEVIRGKSTIGIEVPNQHREMVQLSEMLMSEQYSAQKSPLTMALGKDISGHPVTADLGKMPHLLVAGTTGSGKSVAVNAMLISLLYKATARDVRLILIDPKMLELNVYDGIPHLLTPVVTDMAEAANALRWCVGEMERRYTVMAALKVRNIAGYNKKIRDAEEAGDPLTDPLWEAELSLNPTGPPPILEPLPLIVVVVDEFADMMMQVGKKAEELIARIAQKARAAGIHLILATQRPSVDVITGLIKANVPTRIAFQVSTKIDSRTIIDQGGAETLLGHGDMLYQPPGASITQRVHGAFVDDHEVLAVVAHIKSTGEPQYIEAILQENQGVIPGISGGEDSGGGGEQDALYDQAVNVVTESRRASISFVQRKLKIGYNRAARMIEEMEMAGVVTPDVNGKREVLAPPPV